MHAVCHAPQYDMGTALCGTRARNRALARGDARESSETSDPRADGRASHGTPYSYVARETYACARLRMATRHAMLSRLSTLALLLVSVITPGCVAASSDSDNSPGISRDSRHSVLAPTARQSPPPDALNARDFSARGDGRTDDHAALQAAIHAAQRQGRALYIPAGDYVVGATLVIECSVPNCCEACNTSQSNCGHSACGPLVFNPLRLMGEAQFTTRIIAGPSFQGAALLALPGSSINPPAGTLGNTTETHEISHLQLHANAHGDAAGADYALYAPYITRSRFIALYITDARKAGIYLGYGWINDVLHCMFGGNHIGLQLVEAVNNVNVLNSVFEGNYGPAIVVDGGAQVRIEGNVMESNGGPAVIASGTTALTVHSNYYEANNLERAWPMQWAELDWDAKGRNVSNASVCADLLLNGAPYRFGDVQGQAQRILSPLAPCEGVTYTSNFHGPMAGGCQNYAAVHAVAVSGLTLSGNGAYAHCGVNRTSSGVVGGAGAMVSLRGLPCKPEQQIGAIPPIALLSTGSNASRYWVRDVSFFANTGGFDLMKLAGGPVGYQGVVHGFGRWVALRDEIDEPGSGGGEAALHTFHSPDVLSVNFGAASYPPHWTALPTMVKPSITQAARRFNGHQVFAWKWVGSSEAAAVVAELPLEDNPALAGEAVYIAVQVRSPNASVALAIDPGDGIFLRPHCSPLQGSPPVDSKCWHAQPQGRVAPGMSTGWILRSFQATLAWDGTARFAMHALSTSPGGDPVEIQIAAPVVVGLVGAGWNSLAGQFEPPTTDAAPASLKTDDNLEPVISSPGSAFYTMTDACGLGTISNPTAPLEPCVHPHAVCPGIMHGVEVGTGSYNVTICNNTAWTFRSLWHNSSAVLTPTGFAQTVSNVHLPNTSNAHATIWPPLQPVAPSCPVIPRAPCPPPPHPGSAEGSCSGFLGTGHGGEFIFRVTLHGPDGSTVDLLQASVEQKKRWAPSEGSRISVIKQSQIGAYLATQNVTLDPLVGMTVTANFTVGFDHVNSDNHSVNWFYPCMSMFALPFKRWVAQLTNGTEMSGVFSSADAMTLQQDIKWVAVYDDDSRRGAVYQYPVGHAPMERQKGLASNEFWNRKYDHKLYLQLGVPVTKGAQFGVQHTITAFTAKDTEPWLEAAKKLVRWPAVRLKTDDNHNLHATMPSMIISPRERSESITIR